LADFDEALVDHLLGRSGLAALVATRIFPGHFPQSEQLPAIAYTLEDDSSQQTLQGPSGLRRAIYQINIWADTRRDVMAVARQVRFVLDGYRGALKDISVTGAFLDNMARERDSDIEAYCLSMSFTIHYQEQEIYTERHK
jgi:hypothetical protein